MNMLSYKMLLRYQYAIEYATADGSMLQICYGNRYAYAMSAMNMLWNTV